VEIVYVSTLHPLHASNSLLCLKHGKAVLSEKPLTLNAKEAEEVIQVAREKKLFYMEAMWTRFFPAIQKVRQLIQEGQLGELKLVQANFGFRNPGIPRLSKEELGGGATLDIGVYPISLASMVFGGHSPSKIHAFGSLESGVDAQAVVSLIYKPEELASLAFTILSETPKEATITGSNGFVKIHTPFWCPTKLTINIGGKVEELEFPIPQKNQTWNFVNSAGMQYEGAHANEMLHKGRTESDLISLTESLTIMRTLDEVRRQLGMQYSSEKK